MRLDLVRIVNKSMVVDWIAESQYVQTLRHTLNQKRHLTQRGLQWLGLS